MDRVKMFKTNTFSDPSGAIALILLEYPIRVEREWLADCEITSILDDIWRFRALNHGWSTMGSKVVDKVDFVRGFELKGGGCQGSEIVTRFK